MVTSKFNIGLAPTRRKLSEEHKNKISESLKDKKKKPFTKEHLKNLSISHTGKTKINSSNWKNGKSKTAEGYILIHKPEHKFARQNGYILEHRYIMEKHIGRYLLKTEVVHHIDGDITNNKISNLVLFPTNYAHSKFHKLKDNHREINGRFLKK